MQLDEEVMEYEEKSVTLVTPSDLEIYPVGGLTAT